MNGSEIILYTVHCPVCTMLEKRLKEAGVQFRVEDNVETIKAMKLRTAPMLSVDGKLLTPQEAFQYIKEVTV